MTRPAHPRVPRPAAAAATVLVAVALLALPAAPALACSCIEMTEEEALDGATAVFTGTLVEYRPPPTVTSSMDPATWVFHVHEVHKGSVDRPRQEVTSAVSSASCGLDPPERRRTYRVYADAAGEGAALTASLCGGTHIVADQPVPDQVEPPAPEGDGALRVTGRGGGVMLVVGVGAGLAGAAGLAGLVWWRRRSEP
ncbi:MAG: hypothetical protein WD250_13250 [Egibacteraceae bacterium]